MDGPVDFASAFGRIAFSCLSKELPDIEKKAKDTGNTILTPLVSLDTPGKATVQVVILADPVSCLIISKMHNMESLLRHATLRSPGGLDPYPFLQNYKTTLFLLIIIVHNHHGT